MSISLIRSGMAAFAREFTSNLAVIGRWPALGVEALMVAGCVTFVLGPAAGAVFVVSLCLLAGGRPQSEWIEGAGRGRPFRVLFNLVHQKLGLALVLIWPVLVMRDQVFWAASLLVDVLVPFLMASLVRSWWSPEMDTRWATEFGARETGS